MHAGILENVDHGFKDVSLPDGGREIPEWMQSSQKPAHTSPDLAVGVSQRLEQHRGVQLKLKLGMLGNQRQQSQEVHGRIPQLHRLQRPREQGAGSPVSWSLVIRDRCLAGSRRRKKPTGCTPEAGERTVRVTQEQAVQQRDGLLQMDGRKGVNYLAQKEKKMKR